MTDYSAQEASLDEFVDFFNARDLEAVRDLLDDEVSAPFFGGVGNESVMQGVGELVLGYPGIVATRGELGDEPVVVAWIPGEEREYRRMGYFRFTFTDEVVEPDVVDGELKIEHIDYSDEIDDGSLLAEEPDPADMAEWESWREWEEGAD